MISSLLRHTHPKRWAKVQLLLIASALFSHLVFAATPSPSPAVPETGLRGVISESPVSGGPTRQGVDDSRPVVNALFLVRRADASVVASFTTDNQGRFEISLPPGHYNVIKKSERQHGPGNYGPFEVDVRAGEVTRVEWKCDTGMQ